MRDGSTRKMRSSGEAGGGDVFLSRFRASVVIVSGLAEGSEYTLDKPVQTLGRGPGVDLAFNDNAMSKKHASLELSSGGFRVRDLGSTNGLLVNGASAQSADLKHGDRFQIGEHVFQYVVEERTAGPKTYVVD